VSGVGFQVSGPELKTSLCLQHVPFEGPGVFASLLADAGYSLLSRLVPRDGVPDTLPDFLLVMGGPMSANDPDEWVRDELEFIRRCVDAGIPYLGICLGSQMLARAMGGKVYKGPGVEIGLTEIALTDEGRSDSLFGRMPSRFPVIEWHGEGIGAPPGAAVMASTPLFPVQAFRSGPRALGLLFHLELDEEGIATLCAKCPEDLAGARTDAGRVLADARPRLQAMHSLACMVIEDLAARPL
jgi:GMP synthase (glutamine-hydrolysing)